LLNLASAQNPICSRKYLPRIASSGDTVPCATIPLTTDPKTPPKETTGYLLTNLPGRIQRSIGNPFGLRTWMEYGFTHAKDELGWADDRLTDAAAMARWWEIVRCAATVVRLQSPDLAQPEAALTADETPTTPIQTHPQWDHGQGWKPQLNNLRLVLQPFICIICPCLLLPWLHLIPLPQLHDGLCGRSALINTVRSLVPT